MIFGFTKGYESSYNMSKIDIFFLKIQDICFSEFQAQIPICNL